MTAALCIFDATAAHIGVIQGIAHETWPHAYGEILTPAQIDYMLTHMYAHETLAAQMQHATSPQHFRLIGASPTSISGFAAYELNALSRGVAKLHKLYCLPSMQGRGFGAALVADVIVQCQAQQQHALRLNVNKFNKAIGFYQRLGFAKVKAEVIDIGQGFVMDDDVLEMALHHLHKN